MSTSTSIKLGNTELTGVVSYQILLGEGTGSSSCSVVFADDGTLASTLIQHTLSNGGIRPLPEEQASVEPARQAPGIKSVSTSAFVVKEQVPYQEVAYRYVGVSPYGAIYDKGGQKWKEVAAFLECIRQGITKPHQIAFVLAVFKGETHWRDIENTTDVAGKTKWRGRGLAQLTFKYNYERAVALTGVKEILDNPEIVITNRGINLTTGVASVRTGTTGGRSTNNGLNKWLPNPNSDRKTAYRRLQGGVWRSAYETYYQEYSAKLDEISKLAETVTEKKAPDTTKVSPSTATKTVQAKVDDGSAIPKGSKITITTEGEVFTFWHTGTTHDARKCETTITGQGLRWVINRVERNSTQKGISLKQLATKIANENKLKLKYQAKLNPVYDVVQQKQITDYALLKREVTKAGLFLTEKEDTITITDISESVRNGIKRTFSPENVLNLKLEDAALDASDEIPDRASTYAQFESKVAIDIRTGQLVAKTPVVKGKQEQSSIPGKATESESKVSAASENQTKQNQSRFKRINGLPTTIEIPRDYKIYPLDVVRTVGFSGMLNRVWLVHTVTHSSFGTTTLTVTSPITVVDSQPVSLNSNKGIQTFDANKAAEGTSLAGWVYPSAVRRRVTSPFSPNRWGRPHNGIDIGNFTGDEILAANNGVVSVASNVSGYGNAVYINHGNGIETRYAHLSVIRVKVGQQVKAGQIIALSGNTGRSTAPHLHFEYRKNGKAYNPEVVLSSIKWR